MTVPKISPCEVDIPEPLLRAVAAAERRQAAVLNRVLMKLNAHGKTAAVEGPNGRGDSND